jgi:DNA-binding MarR family transcriptional regulator
MNRNLIELAWESKALNSKIFSLARILLLSALDELPDKEGATYRELRAGLGLDDGTVFANLKTLIEFGYVKKEKIRLEKEDMTQYEITTDGREALYAVRDWLVKWSESDKYGRHK